MSTTKPHTDPEKQNTPFVNPFVKMIGDKKKIDHAIKEGKPLSTLKGIKFVKLLH